MEQSKNRIVDTKNSMDGIFRRPLNKQYGVLNEAALQERGQLLRRGPATAGEHGMKRPMLSAVILCIFGAATGLLAFAGEVSVSEPAEIAGTWVLKATALRRDGERTEENSEWVFQKDGRLVTRGYNYVVERVMTVEDSYQIVDGKIETGQSGKYTVVEKNEKEMVLKGPFGFYFLIRQ